MVKYTPRLLFGTRKTTWGEEINLDRMRRERADRLRMMMKKHGVPCLLLTQILGAGYATGKWSMMAQGLDYVLFPADHDPIIWDIPGNYQQLKDVEPWVLKPENWRCAHIWQFPVCGPEVAKEQSKLFAAEIEQELKKLGLKGEKLGITAGFDPYAMGALRELGIELVDANDIVWEARTIKTKDEILCWRVAIAIADAAWFTIYEQLRPGMTDREVSTLVTETAVRAGADSPALAGFFSGPWTFTRGIPDTDRVILPGDMIHGDIWGISYMGYRTCYYRTFVVGRKPTDKEKDWYKQVLDKQNAIIEGIKPGATTADVAKYMTPASEWGYPDEYYGYSLDICHGLGLSQHEPPIVTRVWSFEHPQVFEPGMTIAVETIAGEHRVGGVRLEDMVVVTEHGAEIVNRFPRDELIAIRPML